MTPTNCQPGSAGPGVVICWPNCPPPPNITMEIRAEHILNPNRKTASDLEAMAYISTVTQAQPISSQWCRIFMYLVRKWMKKKGVEIEDSMSFLNEATELDDYDGYRLKQLKDWIFRQQKKHEHKKIQVKKK